MTVTAEPRKIDRAKYGELLRSALPAPIRNDEDYRRANAEILKLLKRGARRSAEEERLLELWTLLVEHYDDKHYPIADAAPHEVIRFLMEDRGLRNRDLGEVLGSSGVTSEVISGKRKPSREQVKRLAKFFGVSPALFISVPGVD